jgi:PiT family inorganic phosphate transporter
VSFGHGANDAQKTMGVIAALLVSAGYLNAPEDAPIPVPLWLAVAAYGAIALGTVWGGWRIVETMGFRLTTLNARTGVGANIGTTTALFGATALGIPISTTHAAGSSVVGVGAASRRGLNWRVIGRMVLAWVVTMPSVGIGSWGAYRLTQLPTPLAVITVGAVLVALAGWIVYAMWHAKAEHAKLATFRRQGDGARRRDVHKAPAA